MFPNKLLTLLAAIMFGVISLPVVALPTDAQQEMVILSDRAELDRKSGIVIYSGDVVLTQGSLKIEADRLTIMRRNNVLEKAVAEGQPAKYQQQISATQPLTYAEGNRIDYFALRKEVQINGNGRLEQGGNEFSGEQINYDLTNEKVTARAADNGGSTSSSEGKPQRIKVIIQPEAKPPSAPEQQAQTDDQTDVPNDEQSDSQP